ncbi:MAG: M23 family metallopeptidase [Chitinophagaceae bacterium]
MQRRLSFLTILFLYSLSSLAQSLPDFKTYFRNPMDLPMQLSANFGELRPNHWHMGLDIRTNARENQPVYAAAEGYIAHIGIRSQSFGRFIVINHPNGLSTLYGHLNDFFPALEEYVRSLQYEKESWAIELDFSPGQFPVTKGKFIAYSGNTGGSQGPHLHFEIIDTRTGKRRNPLLFDFPISDNVPPDLFKLALYDRNKPVYEQSPRIYGLKKTGNDYTIPKIPFIQTGSNRVSFAIQATDRQSNSPNPNGIYAATLYVDDELRSSFVIDSIDYDESLFINAHIDYKLRYAGGSFLQHLSRMPGDQGPVYRELSGDGVIQLADTAEHAVRIEVADAAGNISSILFGIRFSDSLALPAKDMGSLKPLPPSKASLLEKPGFEFYISDKSLYDTVRPAYIITASTGVDAYSDIHTVGDPSIPLHEPAIIRIKLKKAVPENLQDKLLIRRSDNKKVEYKKAMWQEQWLAASFRSFGSFQLISDGQAPVIPDPGKGDTINLSASRRILFTPRDNTGIAEFRAELDGKWLRFTNDKSRNWIYSFDERCPYGVHHLKVKVEDLAGNVSEKEWWFRRNPYTPPPPKKKTYKKSPARKKSALKKK